MSNVGGGETKWLKQKLCWYVETITKKGKVMLLNSRDDMGMIVFLKTYGDQQGCMLEATLPRTWEPYHSQYSC